MERKERERKERGEQRQKHRGKAKREAQAVLDAAKREEGGGAGCRDADGGGPGDAAGGDGDRASSLRFVPLLQWYDSTHFCSTAHYRSFVFGRRNGKRLVAKGGFIEDKLSQQQLAEIREGGVEANRDWGTYLLDDGSGPER